MKATKLIISFVVVLAVVIGAFFAGDLIQPDPSPITPTYTAEIKEMSDSIKTNCENVSKWDAKLFKNLSELIEQGYRAKRFSEDNYNILKNLLANETCNKLNDILFKEFHSPTCQKNTIEANFEGVKVLTQYDTSLKEDDRVKKMQNCYKLYKDILSFIYQNFSQEPQFYTSDCCSWKPFYKFKDSIMSKANNYKNNEMYCSELSNIKALKDGLNNVDEKLDSASSNYYGELCTQIIKHFNSVDHNADNRKKLVNVYSKFSSEAININSNAVQKLNIYRTSY